MRLPRPCYMLLCMSSLLSFVACNPTKTAVITPSELNNALEKQEARIDHIISTYMDTDTGQATRILVAPSTDGKATGSIFGDKLVLGEVEFVFIQEIGAAFPARVDTGAQTSSIDARNVQAFERDGESWVRFEVPLDDQNSATAKVEAKIVRHVKIKQNTPGEVEKRPVIRAQVQIGSFVAETELNLNDRTHLDYPVLLGRQFIKDIAIVDVSRRFVQADPKSSPDLASSNQG